VYVTIIPYPSCSATAEAGLAALNAMRRVHLPAGARTVCVVLGITPLQLRTPGCAKFVRVLPPRHSGQWHQVVADRRRLKRRRKMAAWLMRAMGIDNRRIARAMGYADRSSVYHGTDLPRCEELITLLDQVELARRKRAKAWDQSFADAAERAIWPTNSMKPAAPTVPTTPEDVTR
jgi:hypothetical protein